MQLIRANDSQLRALDLQTYSAWGKLLTREQFLAREERLRAHPFSRAAMSTWIFCDDNGTILSSCETFRLTSINGGEPGVTYGVASVFTAPENRRRGYAAQMMRMLPVAFATDAHDHHLALHGAILFSDVGHAFYERAGYRALPSIDYVIDLSAHAGPHQALFVGENDLPALHARFAPPRAPFTIVPTAAQLDWHLERERIYAPILRRPRAAACGATVGESSIVWRVDFDPDRLALLWLDIRTPEDGKQLLAAAAEIARATNLKIAYHWQPEAALGTPQPRKGSLPMVWRTKHSPTVPRALWL